MRYALPLALLACLAAGPASRPATTKAVDPLSAALENAQAEQKAAAAKKEATGKALADAKQAALKRVESDAASIKLKSEMDTALATLEAARKGTDPQARLDASSNYNRKKAAYEKYRDHKVATDPLVSTAAEAERKASESSAAADGKAKSAWAAIDAERARVAASAEASKKEKAGHPELIEAGMTEAEAKEYIGNGFLKKVMDTEMATTYDIIYSQVVDHRMYSHTWGSIRIGKEDKKVISIYRN